MFIFKLLLGLLELVSVPIPLLLCVFINPLLRIKPIALLQISQPFANLFLEHFLKHLVLDFFIPDVALCSRCLSLGIRELLLYILDLAYN